MVIGSRLADGSIRLFDENINYREAMTGRYQRIDQSAEQKWELAKRGYQHVQSSFISAIKVEGEDLLIRFLNGSVYWYSGVGSLFDAMMRANSKGQYFWRHIRSKVPYEKRGSLDIGGELIISDEDLFKDLQTKEILDLVGNTVGDLVIESVMINDISYFKFTLEDKVFYILNKMTV